MSNIKMNVNMICNSRQKLWGNLLILCSLFVTCLLAAAGNVEAISDQNTGDEAQATPLAKVVEFGANYAQWSGDYGNSNAQFARFTIARPYSYMWRFDAGRVEMFDDVSFNMGLSYTRYLPDTYSLMIGFSTGTGDIIGDQYRVNLALGRAFLERDNLLGTLGYVRAQSKGENGYDGIEAELQYYANDNWIFGAFGRYHLGFPGRTTSLSGGVGVTYQVYRKAYVGAVVELGEISYMLVGPSNVLEDYRSVGYKLYVTHYQTPSAGFNFRLDYERTEFYRLRGIMISLFKEW
ncbi:MAG: YaiO family outer membrane beta-barrel protein [Candidatus Latescibacteria bacterium]|nr:YaiO family outer membrane beta-barrel protein [Candidatus Latescibacterota bacterium]NIO01042.1 YaiO family outer membrane beta-barrel protein [Candidatus Latescibacterota bacterium]NIO27441.1 YaiO family outer membrane beta-barrel protein [Candidatus Latescibacterota bacterium]NIO54963.1 YaiO family outer membrane beta-barrel protein [Candidatus Latescibacterota bacterium]NIT01052.1 YaiO family outer membrane beta-barrel protein [Candidatus Latescibacterota bacterium]